RDFLRLALPWQMQSQQVEVPRQAGDARVAFATEDEETIPAERHAAPRKESSARKITLDDMRKAGTLAREKIERETRLTTKYLMPTSTSIAKAPMSSVMHSIERQLNVFTFASYASNLMTLV